MKILSILHSLSMTVKYINLDDIYISKDGMSLKLRRLFHLSIFDSEGRIVTGPNLEHILLFYKPNLTSDSFQRDIKLTVNDYDDPFIAPELITKTWKEHTNKIDSWIVGTMLFTILFGVSPESYIASLQQWAKNKEDLDLNKVEFPKDISSQTFCYNPVKNVFKTGKKNEDIYKGLIEAVKMKSFSAIVPKIYLNESENKEDLNGLGVIIDLIASCLSIDPLNRPSITDLLSSQLFKFDNYELILINKFSYNTLRYYSPEFIIMKQILNPIREVKFD